MKKIVILVWAILLINSLTSQVIVKITQSPNNPLLLGVIPSIWADAASTGWSTPDLTNPANAIEAELMFADDGVDTTIDVNGNPTWQDACEPVINDLTGKIAVVYRSFCWHDIKADYAQQAGAVGLIIINRDPGPFAMGGSTVGSNVTIPVVSIGSEEGDLLKAYIAMGGVYAFIGTKVGLNANDLGSSPADIVMAHHQAIPSFFANNGTEFPLDLGLYVFNPGSNNQTGVTASVEIKNNGTTIFATNSSPLNFNAPVGVTVDTVYADLGTYAPATWIPGKYEINYSINLPTDQDTSDNYYSTSFTISTNTFSKSRIDSLEKPIYSTAYSLNETTTQYDDWEACVVFQHPNAGIGNALGMTLSCMPVNGVMMDEIIEIRGYEWNDAFTDLSLASPTFSSLVTVGDGLFLYPDESYSGVNIYIPFEIPFALVNNQKYLFCVYNASDELRLGYDVGLDYTATVDNYLMPIAPVKLKPISAVDQWYWAGFGLDASPSITVTLDMTTSINNRIESNNILPYPNPSKNLVSIPIRKSASGELNVELYDLSGKKLITEKKQLNEEPIKINVASITNGTYVIKLFFSDGTYDSYKIAINR